MSPNNKTGGCATCGTDAECSGSMLTCIHTKAHEDDLHRRASLYGTALDDQAGGTAFGFLSTVAIALGCAAAIAVAIASMIFGGK